MKINVTELVSRIKQAKTISQLSGAARKAKETLSKAESEVTRARLEALRRISDTSDRENLAAMERRWRRLIPRLRLVKKGEEPNLTEIGDTPCFAILPPLAAKSLTRDQKRMLRRLYLFPEVTESATLGELFRHEDGAKLAGSQRGPKLMLPLGKQAERLLRLCLKMNGLDRFERSFQGYRGPLENVSMAEFLADLPPEKSAEIREQLRFEITIMTSGSLYDILIRKPSDFTYRTREELAVLHRSSDGRPLYINDPCLDLIVAKLGAYGLCLKPS